MLSSVAAHGDDVGAGRWDGGSRAFGRRQQRDDGDSFVAWGSGGSRSVPGGAGRGGSAAPPRGRGNRPRTHGSSRVRRPPSTPRAGSNATSRRLRPSASDPDSSSMAARSRTPAPGAGVARRCSGSGRTGCPAGTAGRPPASGPASVQAWAAATVRSAPTSRRPRSTAEPSRDANGRIITSVRPDQPISTRSCPSTHCSGRQEIEPALGLSSAGADKSSAQVTTLIPDLWLCPPIGPLSSRGQRRAAS